MKNTKKILFLLIIIISLGLSIFSVHITNGILNKGYKPYRGIHIVIDAGHGLPDGGARFNGIDESDINLEITKKLKKEFEQLGMEVTLTRNDEYDLAENKKGTQKSEDLIKRISIINQKTVDLFISIHMNSYADANAHGSQIFYANKDNDSKLFANEIQNELVKLTNSKMDIRTGDYYILNKSNKIGILLECGFLSNTQDFKNLINNKYQNEFVKQIRKGVANFLKEVYE